MTFIGPNDPKHLRDQNEKLEKEAANLLATIWLLCLTFAPDQPMARALISYIKWNADREQVIGRVVSLSVEKYKCSATTAYNALIILDDKFDVPPF